MALFSTYALYKEGTRTVVNWLTTTAGKCGYETLKQKRRKKNKNKNKNRKLKAKGIAVDQESSIPAETTPTPQPVAESKTRPQPTDDNEAPGVHTTKGPHDYIISSKELPLMATFISKHFQQTSDFEALPLTLEVLRDVITSESNGDHYFRKRIQPHQPVTRDTIISYLFSKKFSKS